jgi:hypothetical protein
MERPVFLMEAVLSWGVEVQELYEPGPARSGVLAG